ncbi:MAG: HEPN domain-containing protein [Planctomycetota bacterium]
MSAYTAQRYDKGYVDSRFFILASITESLHRELNPDKTLYGEAISKQAIEVVLREVPEHARDVVRSKLAWLNALSFKTRLSELMQAADAVIEDVLGNIDYQKGFTRQVTDWRNEQAHMTDRRKLYVSRDGIGYVRMAAKLKVIIDFQILLQLGFDEQVIAERMRDLRRYWFFASNKTWPWRSDS